MIPSLDTGDRVMATRDDFEQFLSPRAKAEAASRPAWESDPATPKQLAALERAGYTGDMPRTKGEASRIIYRLKRALDDDRDYNTCERLKDELRERC